MAPLPADLLDRRVEITGPVDRKMIINALNSGANVFMADFEDSNAPTWDNLRRRASSTCATRCAATITLRRARDAASATRSTETTATLIVRPRGWHLPEQHVRVDGEPMPGVALRLRALLLPQRAASCSRAAPARTSTCRRWRATSRRGSGTTSSSRAQDALGIPRGHDQGDGADRDAPRRVRDGRDPLRAARALGGPQLRPLGLHLQLHQEAPRATRRACCPTAAQVTMDTARSCAPTSQLLIKTCHRRGAHAMGGMAAQIPIKDDPAANEARAREGARRQAARGRATATTAPGSRIPASCRSRARSSTRTCRARTSSTRQREDVHVARGRPARACPTGTRTEAGLRHNIRVGVQYLEAWLRGSGCVPLYNLMEDAATAEISRAQVWQWIRHGAHARRRPTRHRRALRARARRGDASASRARSARTRFDAGRFAEAARALRAPRRLAPSFDEFLTLPAYERCSTATSTRDRAPCHPGDRTMTPATARPTARRTRLARRRAWTGIVRAYYADGRRAPPRLGPDRAHARELRRRAAVGAAAHASDYVARARRADRQPGGAEVRAGSKAIYLSRLAGRGRRQPRRADVPRPEPLSRRTASRASCSGSTRRCSAPTRSSTPRATTRALLVRADRRRRRGRLRRPAQRLRADEGDDRGRRRRRALRGPARLGEEVRPPGRQGARPDQRSSSARSIAARLAADVMDVPTLLVARTDADSAQAPHQRRRRARPARSSPASARRRASSASSGGLDCAIARGLAYAPYADLVWCETSHARPRRGAAVRRGHPREVPGQAARLQLLAVVQLEEEPRRRDDRASSSASSARWATSSSSSPSPASTRSTTRCSSWRATTGRAAWRPTRELQQAEFAAEKRRLHRDAPPARGRHRLLRRGRRRSSPAARRRRSRSRSRPRAHQF